MRGRTLGALAVALLAALPSAAIAQSPAPDAVGILGRTLDAFLASPSFHVRVDQVGEADPAAGPLFESGSGWAEGDISFELGQADIAFDTPILMGPGEMRYANDGKVYWRLDIDSTGLWHPSASGEDARPLPFDPATVPDNARAILAMPGVTATLGDPVPCPAAASTGTASTCDVVDLAVPADLLGIAPFAMPGQSPLGSLPPTPDVTLRVHVDRATDLPDTMVLRISLPGMVTTTTTVVLTSYGTPVSVEPPPADQTSDDPDIILSGSPVP